MNHLQSKTSVTDDITELTQQKCQNTLSLIQLQMKGSDRQTLTKTSYKSHYCG